MNPRDRLKKQKSVKLGYLLTALALSTTWISSCGRHGPHALASAQLQVPAPLEPTPPQDFLNNGMGCFPGQINDNSTCFPTVAAQSIVDVSYQYADPYHASNFPDDLNPAFYTAPSRFIDLRNVDGSIPLAPNFKLDEFMSAAKGPYGLFSAAVMTRLQKMRVELQEPLVIYSGYRSPAYNKKVGGVSWSRHIFGDGVDIGADGMSYKDLGELCLKEGASFYLTYTDHVHCDWRYLERDPDFYPHQEPPPPALLAQNLSESLMIEVQPTTVKATNTKVTWHVNVQHRQFEDGPNVVYRWEILNPNGVKFLAFQKSFDYQPTIRGIYKISVTVGGSLHTTTDISW